MSREHSPARFGATSLGDEQAQALRAAVRLEWLTLASLVVTVALVGAVVGNSQSMRTAWFEDMLSFLPPLAFLVATRVIRRRPSHRYPYGLHRSIGVGHLVAGVALSAMGAILVVESIVTLVTVEHPTIGSVNVAGTTIWMGWLMMAVMAITAVPPVLLGRAKTRLAPTLRDKLLEADADMNRADWTTGVGSIIGVGGVGLGLWWLDAAAALLIAAGILRDGVRNVRASVLDLIDRRATDLEGKPEPIIERINETLREHDWVRAAASRVRDEGHVLHVESFVVPVQEHMPTLEQLEAASRRCAELHWTVQDIVIVPVRELPEVVAAGDGSGETEGQPSEERS